MRVKVFFDMHPFDMEKAIDKWAKAKEREIISVTQVAYPSENETLGPITTTIFYKEVR